MRDRELNRCLEEIALLATRMEQRKSDFQEAAAQDAGFPVRITGVEVDLAVDYLRTMEEEAKWLDNRQPYGTVAAIFPYDAAPVMLGRLGGAALLTGNRLRFSFSSLTPRTAKLVEEITRPISAFEPVIGMNNRDFGRQCVSDPSVRVLFMSGGSAVGEAYRQQQEAFDKLFFGGPGGMPAAVVFKDADVEAASRFIVRRAFVNGGQYCTTLKKAFVHEQHYDAVRSRIQEAVSTIRLGDPLDPATDIGPIRAERTRYLLQNALERCSGARLLAGGMDGEMIHPLLLEIDGDGKIPDLELFGPFLLLKPFDDTEEVLRELIQTRYGFLLAFFGSATERELGLFQEHFGMVHDNPDFYYAPLRMPFGGKKESGWIVERTGDCWVSRDGAFIYSKELGREV